MERLKYAESHWSREKDEEKALEQYLSLGAAVFNKTKFKLFMALTGDVAGKRILDYGGGAGIMSIPYALKGAEVVLVDAEEGALRAAAHYARLEKVEGRVRIIHSEKFPDELKKERFDIVIAKDIVEHIEDDQRFLLDLSECQNGGGGILLSTQNALSLNYLLEGSYQKYRCGNKSWMGWDATHLRFYTPSSLREKVRKAGYRPERWAGVFIIPYSLLSWLSLFRLNIELPSLRHFDLLFGKWFPFNRFGWNIIVRARKGSGL